MEKVKFFEGKCFVNKYNLFIKKKGKVRLDCTIKEEWREQYSETSACGIPIKLRIKRAVGISRTERESLESTISGKMGLKDVWEISSAIKDSTGYELRLDESVEESREYEAETPKCGRRTLRILQLFRLYTVHYRDDRFLRWKSLSHTILEKLNRWWSYPEDTVPIPECKCEPESEKDIRKHLGIVFEKFGMHVEYQQTAEAVVIPSLGLNFLGRTVEDILGNEIVVDSARLPPYLLFLSGETANSLTGVIRQYREFDSESLTGVIRQYREFDSERRYQRLEGWPSVSRGALGFVLLAGTGLILSSLLRRSPKREHRSSEESANRLKMDRPLGVSTQSGTVRHRSDTLSE